MNEHWQYGTDDIAVYFRQRKRHNLSFIVYYSDGSRYSI